MYVSFFCFLGRSFRFERPHFTVLHCSDLIPGLRSSHMQVLPNSVFFLFIYFRTRGHTSELTVTLVIGSDEMTMRSTDCTIFIIPTYTVMQKSPAG